VVRAPSIPATTAGGSTRLARLPRCRAWFWQVLPPPHLPPLPTLRTAGSAALPRLPPACCRLHLPARLLPACPPASACLGLYPPATCLPDLPACCLHRAPPSCHRGPVLPTRPRASTGLHYHHNNLPRTHLPSCGQTTWTPGSLRFLPACRTPAAAYLGGAPSPFVTSLYRGSAAVCSVGHAVRHGSLPARLFRSATGAGPSLYGSDHGSTAVR